MIYMRNIPRDAKFRGMAVSPYSGKRAYYYDYNGRSVRLLDGDTEEDVLKKFGVAPRYKSLSDLQEIDPHIRLLKDHKGEYRWASTHGGQVRFLED